MRYVEDSIGENWWFNCAGLGCLLGTNFAAITLREREAGVVEISQEMRF